VHFFIEAVRIHDEKEVGENKRGNNQKIFPLHAQIAKHKGVKRAKIQHNHRMHRAHQHRMRAQIDLDIPDIRDY
jgi:hypothetical protein